MVFHPKVVIEGPHKRYNIFNQTKDSCVLCLLSCVFMSRFTFSKYKNDATLSVVIHANYRFHAANEPTIVVG